MQPDHPFNTPNLIKISTIIFTICNTNEMTCSTKTITFNLLCFRYVWMNCIGRYRVTLLKEFKGLSCLWREEGLPHGNIASAPQVACWIRQHIASKCQCVNGFLIVLLFCWFEVDNIDGVSADKEFNKVFPVQNRDFLFLSKPVNVRCERKFINLTFDSVIEIFCDDGVLRLF